MQKGSKHETEEMTLILYSCTNIDKSVGNDCQIHVIFIGNRNLLDANAHF